MNLFANIVSVNIRINLLFANKISNYVFFWKKYKKN